VTKALLELELTWTGLSRFREERGTTVGLQSFYSTAQGHWLASLLRLSSQIGDLDVPDVGFNLASGKDVERLTRPGLVTGRRPEVRWERTPHVRKRHTVARHSGNIFNSRTTVLEMPPRVTLEARPARCKAAAPAMTGLKPQVRAMLG